MLNLVKSIFIFKGNYWKVASRVLLFCLVCFFVWNVSFGLNKFSGFNFNVVKAQTSTLKDYLNKDGFYDDILSGKPLIDVGDVVVNTAVSGARTVIDSFLVSVLVLMGWFVSTATVLFEICVNPEIFNRIFVDNGQTLYAMWGFIRDLLNLAFIFILLFSAFSTVFQISKYHIKNTILWVVLMALLVNFSWPITRVVIDMSNVTMYFFINEMLGNVEAQSTGAKIAGLSNLSNILVPENFVDAVSNLQTSYLLLAIIVTFVFAMTLLSFAVILLIRIIALTLLLVFSPVGFVSAAFPGSYGKYASQWWDKLFAYAMKGPIMIFMLVLAIKMMEMVGGSNVGREDSKFTTAYLFKEFSASGFTGEIVTNVAFMFIPIAILWSAMAVGSMGGDGASNWVTGKAKSWTKKGLKELPNFVGRSTDFVASNTLGRTERFKNFSRPYATARGTVEGVVGGLKTRLVDLPNKAWEREREEAQVRASSTIMGNREAAMRMLDGQRINDIEKDLREKGVDSQTAIERLRTATDKGDNNSAQALRNYLTSLTKDGKVSANQFTEISRFSNDELARANSEFETLNNIANRTPEQEKQYNDALSKKKQLEAEVKRLYSGASDDIYKELAGKSFTDSSDKNYDPKIKEFLDNAMTNADTKMLLRNKIIQNRGAKLLAEYGAKEGGKQLEDSNMMIDTIDAKSLSEQQKLFETIEDAQKRLVSGNFGDNNREFYENIVKMGDRIQARLNENPRFSMAMQGAMNRTAQDAMLRANIGFAGGRSVQDMISVRERDLIARNNGVGIELREALDELNTYNNLMSSRPNGQLSRGEQNQVQALKNYVNNTIANKVDSVDRLDEVLKAYGDDSKAIEGIFNNVSDSVINELKSNQTTGRGIKYEDVISDLDNRRNSNNAQDISKVQDLLRARMMGDVSQNVNANNLAGAIESFGKDSEGVKQLVNKLPESVLRELVENYKTGSTGNNFGSVLQFLQNDEAKSVLASRLARSDMSGLNVDGLEDIVGALGNDANSINKLILNIPNTIKSQLSQFNSATNSTVFSNLANNIKQTNISPNNQEEIIHNLASKLAESDLSKLNVSGLNDIVQVLGKDVNSINNLIANMPDTFADQLTQFNSATNSTVFSNLVSSIKQSVPTQAQDKIISQLATKIENNSSNLDLRGLNEIVNSSHKNSFDMNNLVSGISASLANQLKQTNANNFKDLTNTMLNNAKSPAEQQRILDTLTNKMAENNGMDRMVEYMKNNGNVGNGKEFYDKVISNMMKTQEGLNSLLQSKDFFKELGTQSNAQTKDFYEQIANEMRQDFKNNAGLQSEVMKNASREVIDSLRGNPTSTILNPQGSSSSPGVASILS